METVSGRVTVAFATCVVMAVVPGEACKSRVDAWEALEGVSREDAMAEYVALIDSLKA